MLTFVFGMRLKLNMIERFSKLIALFTITIIIGCSETSEKNSTYFGGKIINPKTDYVVLFDHQKVVDTFYLDQNNTFLGELPSLKEGLFYFRHSNEHQYVYLYPKDSVLIRLNTFDFDESLVFSGKGALRNNLLIDCFLDTEKDNKLFFSFYNLDPESFLSKVKFLEEVRLKRFKDFKIKNPNESDEFLSILKIALTYPLYGHVENYPLLHKMKKHDMNHEVDESFYSHRKKIAANNDSIMYFGAYRNFIVNRIYNKVYTSGLKADSDEFTIALLKSIARDITNQDYKNIMLRQTILRNFYNKATCQYNPETFNTYFSLTDNSNDRRLINLLLNDTKKLNTGKKFNSFKIIDYNHTARSIKSLIKRKNSFIYFWNPEYASKDYIGGRIQYLSHKFPNVKFIGVRIDGDGIDRLMKIDIKDQYYLNSKSVANEFLTSKMPRALIINNKGVLVNGYASLSSRNTFNQLKELSKK